MAFFKKRDKQLAKHSKLVLQDWYIDSEKGQPIRVNEKFRENHKNMDLSREDVLDIRQTIFTKANKKQRNKKNRDKLKLNKKSRH